MSTRHCKRIGVGAIGLLSWVLVASPAMAELRWTATELTSHPEQADAFATAAFSFENVGKSPIEVKSIAKSCKCVNVTAEVRTYAPGERGTVTLAVDRKIHPGRIEQSATVVTDDATTPNQLLRIKMIPKRSLTIEPEQVTWQQGEPGEPKIVKLTVDPKSPVGVLYAVSSSESVKATLKTIERDRDYEVTLTPTDTQAATRATVTIKTDAPASSDPYVISAEVIDPDAPKSAPESKEK